MSLLYIAVDIMPVISQMRVRLRLRPLIATFQWQIVAVDGNINTGTHIIHTSPTKVLQLKMLFKMAT